MKGAGVSTPSNIPDYRGPNGAYVINKDYKPIQCEFMGAHYNRQRYWARSMLGYGTVYNAQPNVIHTTLANWQRQRLIDGIITQNVDSLHLKGIHLSTHSPALSFDPLLTPALKPSTAGANPTQTLELHGTLATVICQSCTYTQPRAAFQSTLLGLNPAWASHSLPVSERVKSVIPPTVTRPDGDTENVTNLAFSTFKYPGCPKCTRGVLKPGVVFFGENIAPSVKDRAMEWVKQARGVLVLGTTLTTYSAFRLVKEVVEDQAGQTRQAWCVNEGRTRADGMWTGGKVEGKVQEVLSEVDKELARFQ
ncbi:DHS-like NAD/FAD-binding domain-containing protein [Catenaria anguillulae PL171]|uniref:DHS-like NAD/FAD-binding domain-containing protein n=1 Tax=Catenaria anguillulae PL171 TaxID=765915 RepID=A0A1Y2HLB4_9FUNG|nr:DHS-like NAD/FAD-binding domain-containing protein [Catenaria anguillulae PL171]